MNKLVNLLFVMLLAIINGCISENNPINSDIWKELQPGGDFYSVANKARIFLDSKDNRANAIKFVDSQLKCRRLSFADQLRLGFIVGVMEMSAKNDEVDSICKLIDGGRNHHDYYGMALSPLPQYILKSIEVFKYKKDIIAYSYCPEGKGEISQYIIQNSFLDLLESFTHKNFGRDYQKWRQWWEQEGQYLKYDKEKQVYYK